MTIRVLVLLLALVVPVVAHAQERVIRLEPGNTSAWGTAEIITLPPSTSCTGMLIHAKGPRPAAPQTVVMPRRDADAAMTALRAWPSACPEKYVVLQILIDGVPALTVIPEAAP